MASRLSSNVVLLQKQLKNVLKLIPAGTQTLDQECFRHHMVRRFKSKNSKDKLSSIIQPLPVTSALRSADDINMGEEMSGALKKDDLLKLLMKFYNKDEIKALAVDNGLDRQLFHKAYISFRKFCVSSKHLPVDLHIVFSDILQGSGHVDDIFPYFLDHCYEIFPHLECIEDLKKISDLRHPANWYPDARSIERKFIFHAGPTNSGKTHHALERFNSAKSGIYCGPLKLLATEVFHKSNEMGTPCDLVTGEERKRVSEDGEHANHVACTIEMANLTVPYDVAVIDEIQMIRDHQRGWAWTRAVLGLFAREIHVCGEASCLDILSELTESTAEELEVRKYKRLSDLTYLDHAIDKFDNIRPGDCIVCFNKNDIYYVTRQLEMHNKECAVIYGSLPPSTKLAQSAKFNDPNNSCNVMVATDAIGMGLNLAIKRIVFYSLIKPMINDNGDIELDLISTSQALQIGGRAGRFNTAYEHGEVTTFYSKDLKKLKEIVNQPLEPVAQAGLHPTADQIELFAYHLPKSSLSNLIEIFELICELDNESFFMCKSDDFKFLADVIEHVPLSLRVRYVFCCAPIPVKQPFACTMFLKFARRFSRNQPLTVDWLCRQIGWPLKAPGNLVDLVHLECVFDIMDLYLWLSYRFQDMFPDVHLVRRLQKELDQIIQIGVHNIVRLVNNQELTDADELYSENDFTIKRRKQQNKAPELVLDVDKIEQGKANSAKKLTHSKLASRLVDRGVINKEILDKLKFEWQDELAKKTRHHYNSDEDDDNYSSYSDDDSNRRR